VIAFSFDVDSDDNDLDEQTTETSWNLSKAFDLAAATIDTELDAFMDMASTTFHDNASGNDDDSSASSQCSGEPELSAKERLELEEIDDVARLLRQNSRYAYTSRATASPSSPPQSPTRRANVSSPPISPMSPSSRSLDVMSNTRVHQRAVFRLKRQYRYLAATRQVNAGTRSSDGEEGFSISESDLVANVLLLQAERMASKVTRSCHGLASPLFTSTSLLERAGDVSPFSLSVSPIRTVSIADESAKATPEQLAAIEQCLNEEEAAPNFGTTETKKIRRNAKATNTDLIPFLPTADEMTGTSDEERHSSFAPRSFTFPDQKIRKLNEPIIAEDHDDEGDDEEYEGGDTLSPLPSTSAGKSDRWMKYKRKGTKRVNHVMSRKLLDGAQGSNFLQAKRPHQNHHFSIFQNAMARVQQQEASKKALREKKEQLLEDVRNHKLYDSFVEMKAAAATRWGEGSYKVRNESWPIVDLDAFDGDEDMEGDGEDPASSHHFSNTSIIIGGMRKHLQLGGRKPKVW